MTHRDGMGQQPGTRILGWAADQPWARAMAACAQDSGWHAEGDVWTHTTMVVAELERLPEWPDLGQSDRARLTFAALFHDVGKPSTTRPDPETGRTRSPKHAIVGMEIARRVLRDLGCGLLVREEICNLVRYHGRPAHLLEKADPALELISLSWLVNHRLLYLLALADTRGRQTADMARPEDNLGLWKLVAEENGCFDRPFAFANDQARFLFYEGKLSSLHYTPHEDERCTVTMMSGLPGSGKDTWLERHRPDLPVVSLDDLRSDLGVEPSDDQGEVIQLARERCREHLRMGRHFAFNATNTIRQTRKRWIDLFVDYGARIELVYLEPSLPVIFERNARRPRPVPRRAIERLVERLEPPTQTEAHSLVMIDDPVER
jgi:putative nucleotidyltransferase with HDIG domain